MSALLNQLKGFASPVLFLVAISLFAGCYTSLRHPASPDVIGETVSHQSSCYDCHDEAAFYYHHYGVYYDYYDTPWFGYYSDPWWMGAGWLHGGSVAPDPLDSGSRRSWSRGAPIGSARGAQGSTSAPAYLKPGYSGKTPTKPTKPKEGEKKAEEKSKSRRTYKRGKKK